MDTFDLWLPIAAAAVAVHVCSTIAWTVLPHHRSDFRQLPEERQMMQTLAGLELQPGRYMFPYHDALKPATAEEKAAAKEKWNSGCAGTLTLFGNVNLVRNIALTFLTFLVASYLIGYLASMAISPGADFERVFRFVTTAGVMTYCVAAIPNAIWFKHRMLTSLVDGVVFALVTGLLFAALWPS